MKKKNALRVLATAFAVTVLAGSPVAMTKSYALGLNIDANDDTVSGITAEDVADFWANWGNESSSSNSGSSYVEPSYSEPSSGTSSSEPSSNASSESNVTSSGGTSNAAVATTNSPNNVTVNVTGGQKFRIVTSSDHKSYQIYHCGQNKVTFKVTNSEGTAVTFSNVKLEQGADNLWYAVVNFAQGVDTTGLTVTASNGDATYLSTELGVSGIKIGGEVVFSTVPVTEATVTE